MQDSALLSPLSAELDMVSGDVLMDLIADSVICADDDGRILLFNRAAEGAFGYLASEVIGQHVEMLLPPRFREDHAHQVRSFALGGGSSDRLMGHDREVWGHRKNGEEFSAEATVSRHTIKGRTILTVVLRDISERKKLEQQREAIAGELDHRVRNVLFVVNSLVRLSAKTAENVEEFKQSLLGRLSALANTQSALRFGAQQSASLSELLLGELKQYRTKDGRNIVIEGPHVALGASVARNLALAFHELATNSAKYGALNVPAGRVTVTCTFMAEGRASSLLIEWRERGGPLVKPPGRQGFGTTLINQVIRGIAGAEVSTEYLPEGLVCRMTLPAALFEEVREDEAHRP